MHKDRLGWGGGGDPARPADYEACAFNLAVSHVTRSSRGLPQFCVVEVMGQRRCRQLAETRLAGGGHYFSCQATASVRPPVFIRIITGNVRLYARPPPAPRDPSSSRNVQGWTRVFRGAAASARPEQLVNISHRRRYRASSPGLFHWEGAGLLRRSSLRDSNL